MAVLDQADSSFSAQVAAKAKQVRDAVAARAGGRPAGLADGLVTPPGTGQFQQAQTAVNVSRGQTLRTPQPTITPAEAASFNAQSGGRFNATQPVAPQAPAGSVPKFDVLPHETAAFNAQSNGGFSAANPGTPTLGDIRAGGNAAVARPGTLPTGTGAGPNIAVQRAQPSALGDSVVAPTGEPVTPGAGASGTAAFGESMGARAAAGLRAAAPVMKYVKPLGIAGGLVAAGSEGLKVYDVAHDKNSTKGDVLAQAGEGAGKLAAAGLGAEAGATLGAFGGPLAPVTVPVGAILGGAAGYFGGEKLIQKGRQLFGGDGSSPIDQVGARQGAATAAAAKPGPDFSNVTGTSSTVRAMNPGEADRTAANDGITPIGDRKGDPSEVVGTFNGRKITRGDSAQLSSQLNGPVPAAGIGAGLAAQPTASSAALGSGVSPDFSGRGSEDRLRDLTNPNTAAGKLYAQLSEDKTPSGKRGAQALLEQYLGTGSAELGQRRNLAGTALTDSANLQRGREGDAASLAQEQTRVAGARKSQPQYVFNADGSVSQLSDGVLSDVKDPSGKSAVGKAGKATIMDQDKQEAYIKTRLDELDGSHTWTPEEAQAQRQKIIDEINAGNDPKKKAAGAAQ